MKEAKVIDIRQNMQRQEHAILKMYKKEDKCKYCDTGNSLSNALNMARSAMGDGNKSTLNGVSNATAAAAKLA